MWYRPVVVISLLILCRLNLELLCLVAASSQVTTGQIFTPEMAEQGNIVAETTDSKEDSHKSDVELPGAEHSLQAEKTSTEAAELHASETAEQHGEVPGTGGLEDGQTADVELPKAEQADAGTQDDKKPAFKTGLTGNFEDMGIDSAEDTNDEIPMDTDATEEAAPDDLMEAKREKDKEVEEEPDTLAGDETRQDDSQIPPLEVAEDEEKDKVTEKLETESTTPGKESAESRMAEANKDNITDEEKLLETTPSEGDGDSATKILTTEKSAKDLRRSRSKEETDADEKGKLDEQQSERSAKKPKTDRDVPSQPAKRTLRPSRPDLSKMRTLKDFGYQFNEEGELRQIGTGSPFVFEVVPNDRSFNQKHYEALGEIITEHVFGLMESECNLQRAFVPVEATVKQPRTFIFVSDHVLPVIHDEEPSSDKKLLVLIHGSGVVRAGQWARRLIINNNLSMGTMIPYIKKAMEENYEVMLLNTNYNSDKGKPIPGSTSPEAHGKYVWKHFISEWPGKVAIVAHSAGGYVTVEMAKQGHGFMEKVFAVGFTDSVHSLGYYTSREVSDWFVKHSKNWVSSGKPLDTPLGSYGYDCPRVAAGTSKHEETSYYSMDSVFKFFSEMEEITRQEAERTLSEPAEGDETLNGKAPDAQIIDREEKPKEQEKNARTFLFGLFWVIWLILGLTFQMVWRSPCGIVLCCHLQVLRDCCSRTEAIFSLIGSGVLWCISYFGQVLKFIRLCVYIGGLLIYLPFVIIDEALDRGK